MPEPNRCTKCGTPTSSLTDGLCPECNSHAALTRAPVTTPNPFTDVTIGPQSGSQAVPQGNQFGDYELLEEIARGGMGVVYKARHKKLNRIAAVKMILGGRFSSPDELQRFHVEAEAAAKLDHPGIVPIYEIGEQDGRAFFAMKYIDGGSLAQRMDQFRADPKLAMNMLAQVARAVNHAHQRGILHRDLKPANILIDEANNPLVTDLGLAKNTADDSNLTNAGAILGSPSYMPPEQADGQQAVTTAADVYAIGAIMYELLTGQPPHRGKSPMETVMKVITENPVLPRKLDPKIDPELELICLKCLAREPEARYSSAASLATDLESWLAGNAISIKPPSIGPQIARWMRQHRRAVYVAFAAMIAIAFTFPIIATFFGGGTDLGEVYEYFPESERPWFFSIATLPIWVAPISMGMLILIVWPSIGLWNAMVTRPKTIRSAIVAGALTSALCAAIIFVLLGWLVIVLNAGSLSDKHLRTLGRAVWVPKDTTLEKATEAALEAIQGLENIPEQDRAKVFADRIIADQVASGPKAITIMLFVCVTLAIPVTIGTVYAFILIGRKLATWLLIIRYFVAWHATTVACTFASAFIFGSMRISGKSASEQPITILMGILIGTAITYLMLRRWKKRAKGPAFELP